MPDLHIKRIKPQPEISTGLRECDRGRIQARRVNGNFGKLELAKQSLWKPTDNIAQIGLPLGFDRSPFAVHRNLIERDPLGCRVIIQIGACGVKTDRLRAARRFQLPRPDLECGGKRPQGAIGKGFQPQSRRQRRIQHGQPAQDRTLRRNIARGHVDHGQRHLGGTTAARTVIAQRQPGHKIPPRQQRKIARHTGAVIAQVQFDRAAIDSPAAPGPGIGIIDHHPLRLHLVQRGKGRAFENLVELVQQIGQSLRLPDRPGRGPESHGKGSIRRPVQRNLCPGQGHGLRQNLPPEQQPTWAKRGLHHRHPGQFAAIHIAQGHVNQPDLRMQIGPDRDGNRAKLQRPAIQRFGGLRLDPVLDPAGGSDFLTQHQKSGNQGKHQRGQ